MSLYGFGLRRERGQAEQAGPGLGEGVKLRWVEWAQPAHSVHEGDELGRVEGRRGDGGEAKIALNAEHGPGVVGGDRAIE